jgi:ATP/maltotriose-dependent transcriptional regulator MalT
VAQGLSNRKVANRVFLSPHTVAFHLRHIFWKLGVTSRVQFARMAAEQGSLIGDGNMPSFGSSRLICASWRNRRT